MFSDAGGRENRVQTSLPDDLGRAKGCHETLRKNRVPETWQNPGRRRNRRIRSGIFSRRQKSRIFVRNNKVIRRGAVAQSVEHPSEVPVWCNESVHFLS